MMKIVSLKTVVFCKKKLKGTQVIYLTTPKTIINIIIIRIKCQVFTFYSFGITYILPWYFYSVYLLSPCVLSLSHVLEIAHEWYISRGRGPSIMMVFDLKKAIRFVSLLTHWGRVTHICVSKLTIIGSDNSLSPERRQATIWTNAGMSNIGTLGTNCSEILSEIRTFSFNIKSSAKWRPPILSRPQCVENLSFVI